MIQLIKSSLITWARERRQLSTNEAAEKLDIKADTFLAWENGEKFPNLKEIENIATKFYVPLGYLFLDAPPVEKLPIPDFRTFDNDEITIPSPELLDVVYDAQIKQNWLKEIREEEGIDPILPNCNRNDIVHLIRQKLAISQLRNDSKSDEDFLKNIISKLDQKGFMIIRNGVVGNNTHRPLNVKEFRGFALHDNFAPLIFINGKDFKAGQIFTIMHELAHLFLGESGVDGNFTKNVEQECNKIAAEILVPKEELERIYQANSETEQKIAKQFKVSCFVILIKAKQLGLINQDYFNTRYEKLSKAVKATSAHQTRGGDYYANVKFKAGGENFLHTVINHTLAGKVLYRDAYRLTGLKDETFSKYCKNIGAA